MRMNWLCVLALGLAVTFAGVAGAVQMPTPMVYLNMEGNLANSGAGGSAYDGTIEMIGPNGGTPIYVTGMNSQGIKINPDLIYLDGTADEDAANDVAIPYTLTDKGTIALWYSFTSPHYDYQQLFNNSGHHDQWECWADAYDGHDEGKGHCVGARAGGYYTEDMMMSYGDGWHHVALTWARHDADPTKVDFTIYYDGATTDGARVTDVTWADPGDTVYLGGNYGNSNGNGTWDEVLIFDECLTDDQIVAVMDYATVPGDANNDGKVDGSDVTILAGNWQAGVDGSDGVTWGMGDFNNDGKVDGSDVTILAGNWQYGVTATASAVPEPSMIMLLLTAIGSLLIWKRRS